jgi:hypothetical protein
LLSFIFSAYIDCSRGFHLGILQVYILYFNQSNLLFQFLFLYCLAPLLFNSCQCISLYYRHTHHSLFSFPILSSHSPFRQIHS